MAVDLRRQYIDDCEANACDVKDYRFELTRRELGLLGFGLVCSAHKTSGAAIVSRLHMGVDGTITVMTSKVEMGQGMRTMLTAVVADTLRVDPARVRVAPADTDISPDDGGTWASLTAPETVPLVRAAAQRLRAMLDETEGTSRTVTAPVGPVDGVDIVTGEHKYPTDFAVPGMQFGVVLRNPAYRGKLLDAPTGKGIVRDGDFLGVVGPSAAQAAAFAATLKPKWGADPLPAKADMFARFKAKSIPPKPGEGGRYPTLVVKGDIAAGFSQSARRHEASYNVANIAHVPLEPRAAVAEWKDDRLTVWSGTQAPFLVRKELASAFRISETSVRVVSIGPGGAFGGKQRGECELEAARLAKSAGLPVKLAWTREEEFTASYCRPAGIVELSSGVDAKGRIQAWHHRNYNSGSPALRPPYDIPHYACEFYRSESPVRQGSYRSLAAVANTFARESHVNELAAAEKADPLEYRIRNIDDARLREALERGAELFGWGKQRDAAVGLACNIEKNARLALFVEMEEKNGEWKARRMVFLFDAGRVLHPAGLESQAQGGLMMGLGGALFEELEFDSKAFTNARLSRYRVPRFSDMPEIQVHLIDRPEIASTGAGEAPITVVAPAIAAALKGRVPGDLRSLPLFPRVKRRT